MIPTIPIITTSLTRTPSDHPSLASSSSYPPLRPPTTPRSPSPSRSPAHHLPWSPATHGPSHARFDAVGRYVVEDFDAPAELGGEEVLEVGEDEEAFDEAMERVRVMGVAEEAKAEIETEIAATEASLDGIRKRLANVKSKLAKDTKPTLLSLASRLILPSRTPHVSTTTATPLPTTTTPEDAHERAWRDLTIELEAGLERVRTLQEDLGQVEGMRREVEGARMELLTVLDKIFAPGSQVLPPQLLPRHAHLQSALDASKHRLARVEADLRAHLHAHDRVARFVAWARHALPPDGNDDANDDDEEAADAALWWETRSDDEEVPARWRGRSDEGLRVPAGPLRRRGSSPAMGARGGVAGGGWFEEARRAFGEVKGAWEAVPEAAGRLGEAEISRLESYLVSPHPPVPVAPGTPWPTRDAVLCTQAWLLRVRGRARRSVMPWLTARVGSLHVAVEGALGRVRRDRGRLAVFRAACVEAAASGGGGGGGVKMGERERRVLLAGG
ncbi:hypothetical protein HDU96_009352 [Phlyctochytrium bullatum]|nr:hypothetical protein HDU96_009352 [Phlyctochytrium bullatum]